MPDNHHPLTRDRKSNLALAILLVMGAIVLMISFILPKYKFEFALYYTYFVMDASIIIVIGVSLLTFLTSLIIALMSRFTNPFANSLLIISLVVLILFARQLGLI